MKVYAFPDKKIWKVLIAALLLALLLLSRDVLYILMVGVTESMFLTAGVIAILGIAFLAVNWRSWKELLRDRRILFALVSGLVMIVPMVIKRDWQLMYLSVLMYILGCVLISFFASLEDVAKFYVISMVALGLYSVLANYILRLPVDAGLMNLPVVVNGKGRDFYVMGASFVSIRELTIRNFGLFREPGVYQFFILLALYLTFYHVSWKKECHMWISCVVLSVTMLSTLATGGVAELGMLALVVYFDKKYYKNKFLLWLAIFAAGFGAAAVVYSILTQSLLYGFLVETFGKLFLNAVSLTERIGSIKMNLQLFLSSPLVGVDLRDVLHGIENNTSSSTILFAMLGIFGGVYHLAGWVALVWKEKRRWLSQTLNLIILLLSCNTCNIMWNIWFWMFPTMALCHKALPLLKGKNK